MAILEIKVTMEEILTFDELRELSGFKNLKRISLWLEDAGVSGNWLYFS